MIIAPVGVLQRSIWNMFCRFLDERRSSRIKMVPSMESLTDFIAEDQLLATHGGKNPWRHDPSLI